MSAPPIGMMSVTPAISARAKIAQNAHRAWPPLITSTTISTMTAAAMAMFSRWRAGSMIGAPDMLPFSLAKAIREPVKVIAPMARPRESSMRLSSLTPPPAIVGSSMWYATGV